MGKETVPTFDQVDSMTEAELMAAEAGIELPPDNIAAPTSEPAPVASEPAVPPAPADTPEPASEPAKETVPTETPAEKPAEAGEQAPVDPLEEIRTQLALAQHDNQAMRDTLEQFMSGQVPQQPDGEQKAEDIKLPELELTEDELAEAQATIPGLKAVLAKTYEHAATSTEQVMLQRIQAVMPKIVVKLVGAELTRRENVAKGDQWERDHPEFAGQMPRVGQIMVRERRAHPDWTVDQLLEEGGKTAAKELRIPLGSGAPQSPPSPVVTPGARPAPVATPKRTRQQQEMDEFNKALMGDE